MPSKTPAAYANFRNAVKVAIAAALEDGVPVDEVANILVLARYEMLFGIEQIDVPDVQPRSEE